MSPLLRLEDVAVHFPVERGLFGRPGGAVRAVDGVTLQVGRGEIVGLVGESGCGKSTLARAAVRLVEVSSGRVLFEGQDVTRMPERALRPLRRRLQITFQDAGAALDPRLTVCTAIEEALAIHGLGGGDRRARVAGLLRQVGLGPELGERYPHELSGGQRHRVGLARALAVEPALVVLDEPLSGLDASLQAQIVNLLSELQERLGLAYLLVSHDLRVVAHLADRVAVMYLGRLVEVGPAAAVFASPAHPYTRALLAASMEAVATLEGEPPSPVNPPAGCRFHPRCPHAEERCRREDPAPREVGPEHQVACVLAPTAVGRGVA